MAGGTKPRVPLASIDRLGDCDMCGIAGILRTEGNLTDSDRMALDRMLKVLRHRGPDSSGTWEDSSGKVLLGHTRLSIRDLSSAGYQPMVSRSGRSALAYNGEIYSTHELERAAAIPPNVLSGTSDTEILLESLEKIGFESTMTETIGMFAFAYFDERRAQLVLCRDRLGIKPLYWTKADNVVLFASELKALIQHPLTERELDSSSIGTFLRHDYIPAPYSIYKSVKKIKPGFSLTVDTTGSMIETPYWKLEQRINETRRNNSSKSELELHEGLEQLLTDAVSRRLVSDVPVGSLLSGGVDSSLVTALMASGSTSSIRTYSVGFLDQKYDESGFALEIARHLETEHTSYIVTPSDALTVIPQLGELYSEPFADSSQIPTLLLSRLVAEDLRVVLTGDGGDETFGGYDRYLVGESIFGQGPTLALSHRLKSSIQGMRRRQDGIGAILRDLKSKYGRWRTLSNLHDETNRAQIYQEMMSHWSDLSQVMLEPAEQQTIFSSQCASTQSLSALDFMRYVDLVSYLPDDILVKVDRASMAFGLEARVPLLDHRVVEYSWLFDQRALLSGGSGKLPLRKILEKHVPRELFERPKMGFGAPIAEWLRDDLKEWAADLLHSTSDTSRLGLNPDMLEFTWQQHLSGHDHAYRLWSVLMLIAWLQASEHW